MTKFFQFATLFYIVIVASNHTSTAQAPSVIANKDFRLRKSLQVQGDFTFIANNSISINGPRRGTTTPVFLPKDDFNFPDSNSNIRVDYIDIDNDEGTFSSSAASFEVEGIDYPKILYAGLYWSGTYRLKHPNDPERPDNDGNNYPILDPRIGEGPEGDFRKIKFKTPGGNYQDIVAGETTDTEVIYNGYRNTADNPSNTVVKDVPYVCYADVTQLVNEENQTSGEYTVANVKAFTGDTDGSGSTAGWILVIAFENPSSSIKEIFSYDGYFLIRSRTPPVTYRLNNFVSPPSGPLLIRYGTGALEGESGLVGDRLDIKGTSTPAIGPNQGFTTLTNSSSSQDNFFDSSISIDGANIITRRPASQNTLGFDADLITVPPGAIPNSETGIDIRLSTRADGFAQFLNVFSVGKGSTLSVPVHSFDSTRNDDIRVFPNPTQKNLTFSQSVVDYSLYTIHGKKVLTGRGQEADLSQLPSQLYILELSLNNDEKIRFKILKK